MMLIRCSSLGKIMTEPKTKGAGLSEGAKTYLRELAAEEIFGVRFSIDSKYLKKGIEVENDSIALLNSVRGTSLVKNTERRNNDYITGECDLYDAENKRGHDLKSSWSIQTFPLLAKDAVDKGYEWQMRGYMMLWDAEEWSVDYALVDTPERLIGYEPLELHLVSHIPERLRLTSWALKRDMELEAKIVEKVKLAREYLTEVYAEFERTHQ
jgi:hypothetical protein